MSELNPKSKRMKMDEYNEKRRNSRKKENPLSGACSSNTLLNNSGPELEKVRGKKRKRVPKSPEDSGCSLILIYSLLPSNINQFLYVF